MLMILTMEISGTKQCNDCGPIMVIADAYDPLNIIKYKVFNKIKKIEKEN